MPLPQLPTLNRPEAMSTRGQKFPESLTGNHKEAVLGFKYIPEKVENGKKTSACFQARVKILTSDNSHAAGRSYTLRWYLGGQFPEYAEREMRSFIAACAGVEDSPTFDADMWRQKLVDADETNGFDDEKTIIFHTRTSKTKQKAELKNGVATAVDKTYANDYFNPVMG